MPKKKKSRRPGERASAAAARRPSQPRNESGSPLRQLQGHLRELQRPATASTSVESKFETAVCDDQILSLENVPFESLSAREPQALGITYRFDTRPAGAPYEVSIRLLGQRLGAATLGPRDHFDVVHRVAGVLPGSGNNAHTWRMLDVEPGEWRVRAEGQALGGGDGTPTVVLPSAVAVGRTGYAPVVRVRAPGVTLGAWPGFVFGGVVVGLIVQAFVAARLGLPVGTTVLITLLSCLVGLAGAKAYFLALHPDRQLKGLLQVGMAVQGFVLALVGSVVAGAFVAGLPLGKFLDATGTGLMFGMALGRFGCFFGGCCAGRPTGAKIGVWSSNRDRGLRRVPTQFMESAVAFVIGTGSLVLLTRGEPSPHGVVFVAILAAYTLARQLLFPLRDLPRTTSQGRLLVLAATALALAGAVVVSFTY